MATHVKWAVTHRFSPTEAQAAELSRTFGCVRKVYDLALAARTEAWARGERVHYHVTSATLTAWEKTGESSYLAEVSSVPVQQAPRHPQGAFSSFFGNNRAGVPTYDPDTGRTFDGVNRDSGAESTIHGLLTMLALDADPAVARTARVATVRDRHTWRLSEAEDAALSDRDTVITPDPAWTGEALWSSGDYVFLERGASLTVDVPAAGEERLALPVAHRAEEPSDPRTDGDAGQRSPGTVDHGGAGERGVSAAPGALETLRAHCRRTPPPCGPPSTVARPVSTPPAPNRWSARDPGRRRPAWSGAAARFHPRPAHRDRRRPGRGSARVSSYDSAGRLLQHVTASGRQVSALVLSGGFTVVERCCPVVA